VSFTMRCGDSHANADCSSWRANRAQTATVELAFAARLLRYAAQCLGLEKYLRQPRRWPAATRLPLRTLLWSMLIARLLREISFHAVNSWCTRAAEPYACAVFGDDGVGLLQPNVWTRPLRAPLLIGVLHRAKRNKPSRIRGSLAWHRWHHRRTQHSPRLRVLPSAAQRQERSDRYSTRWSGISVVEPACRFLRRRTLRPWRQRVCAGQRLLARARSQLGARFADYLVSTAGMLRLPFCTPPIAPASHHRSPQGQPPGTFSIRGTALRRCFSDQSLSRWQRPCGDLGCGRLRPWETLLGTAFASSAIANTNRIRPRSKPSG